MAGSFVKVRGTQLVLNDKPFVFAGANCYFLAQRLGSAGNVAESIEVLDSAQKLGLTVMRTWAFNDGAQNWLPFQPQPGVYDESMLVALDTLLVECSKRGLRVMPTLTNYWKDYGGMSQYARWSSKNESASSEDFYNDAGAQTMFLNFIKKIVTRINSVTKIAYKDDPTIMAWDICNEPECTNDPSAKKIAVWMDATAKYVKSLDSNHLVTCGSEGFFGGSSTAAWLGYNPFNAIGKGCDFMSEFASPYIDFACIHMWHDQWMPGQTPAVRQASAKMWILGHEKACRQVLKKPLVIQEYGAKAGPLERAPLFRLVHSMVLKSIATSGALVGACAWMLGARSIADYDGYTIYQPLAPGASGVPAPSADPDTVRELTVFAAKIKAPPKKPVPAVKPATPAVPAVKPAAPATPAAKPAAAAAGKTAGKARAAEAVTLEEFDDDTAKPAAAVEAPLAAVEESPAGEEGDWEGLEGFPEGLDEPVPEQAQPEQEAEPPVQALPPVVLKPLPAANGSAASNDVGLKQVDQALGGLDLGIKAA